MVNPAPSNPMMASDADSDRYIPAVPELLSSNHSLLSSPFENNFVAPSDPINTVVTVSLGAWAKIPFL